jgi:hypothetical protein
LPDAPPAVGMVLTWKDIRQAGRELHPQYAYRHDCDDDPDHGAELSPLMLVSGLDGEKGGDHRKQHGDPDNNNSGSVFPRA